jgi:hypothetical protein
MQKDQEVPRTQTLLVVKRICAKPNLVTLKVWPFCTWTFAPVETLCDFWYGCEKCCQFLLNFFYRHKTVTFDPNPDSLEEPEVTKREIWRMPWLADGWNLSLQTTAL